MSIRIAPWILFCALAAAGAAAQTSEPSGGTDATWPQRFEKDGNALLVYQPQMESWPNRLELTGRVAAVVLGKDAAKSAGGSLDITARTDTDTAKRSVVLSNIRVTGAHFPGPDGAAAEAVARELFPRSGLTLSLDYMLAALALSDEKLPGVAVSNETPKIFVSEQPARLVAFEGTPVFATIEGTELQYALNTNWPVFRSPDSGYFILDSSGWLTKDTLESDTWGYASQLPADFEKLPDTAQWKDVRARIPAAPSDSLPPLDIFVTTRPAELIVAVGKIDWKKVAGTHLFYAQNTSSILFWEGEDKDYYYLVSGRWFRARSVEGPWKYASADLPADFASLPADGPLAAVRASVPGSEEAREAAFRSTIPHVAVVDRKKTNATATYAGEPQFAAIEGTSMSYAVNSPDDVIHVGDAYFLCKNGVWFTATSPAGPWTVAGSVPDEIYTIPPSSPVYNTTYVRLYESDDDSAVYGYTDGYLGTYVDDGVLVWGSGYYYPPYVEVGAVPYFFPRAYTYGCDAYYDPVDGVFRRAGYGYGPRGGVGAAAVYNPYTGTYARGVVLHGPDETVAYGRAVNPRTGLDEQGVRRSDPYAAWQETVVPRGPRVVPGVETAGQRAEVARGTTGQVYAARDGSLYRATGKRWEPYEVARGEERARERAAAAPVRREVPAEPREAEVVSSGPREGGVVRSRPGEAEVVTSGLREAQGLSSPEEAAAGLRRNAAAGLGGQEIFREKEEYRELEAERMARQRARVNEERMRSFGGGAYRSLGGGRFAGRGRR